MHFFFVRFPIFVHVTNKDFDFSSSFQHGELLDSGGLRRLEVLLVRIRRHHISHLLAAPASMETPGDVSSYQGQFSYFFLRELIFMQHD